MTTPYCQVEMSLSGGAYATGAQEVTSAPTTLDLRLASLTDIHHVLWEVYGYPEGLALPAGWSRVSADQPIYYEGLTPPQITTSGWGFGKYLVRATANYGQRGGALTVVPADGTTMRDESVALSIQGAQFTDAAAGTIRLEDISHLEGNQFSAVRKWARSLQRLVRYVSDVVATSSYNVRAFGATGDGTTDDTAAIQAAFDAAFATGGGVYVPAGEYNVSATITAQTGVNVRGEGSRHTIIRPTADLGAGVPVLDCGGKLESIRIDGNGFACDGIHTNGSNRKYYYDVEVRGCDGVGINHINGNRSVFVNVKSLQNSSHGFRTGPGAGSTPSACSIVGGDLRGNGGAGLWGYANSLGWDVESLNTGNSLGCYWNGQAGRMLLYCEANEFASLQPDEASGEFPQFTRFPDESSLTLVQPSKIKVNWPATWNGGDIRVTGVDDATGMATTEDFVDPGDGSRQTGATRFRAVSAVTNLTPGAAGDEAVISIEAEDLILGADSDGMDITLSLSSFLGFWDGTDVSLGEATNDLSQLRVQQGVIGQLWHRRLTSRGYWLRNPDVAGRWRFELLADRELRLTKYLSTGVARVRLHNDDTDSREDTRLDVERLECSRVTSVDATALSAAGYVRWEASTFYASGALVANDGGKVYECQANGTSAGSGGPTGTGTGIADGTTSWDYVGDTDVELEFGFGKSATATIASGSTSMRGRMTINPAGGSGFAANPDVVITFPDGAFPTAPFAIVSRPSLDVDDQPAVALGWATTASTLAIKFLGTPVNGESYVVEWIVLG